MSAAVTVALPICTFPFFVFITSGLPKRLWSSLDETTEAASSFPATTWYLRMEMSSSLFSCFKRLAMVAEGSLAKASSAGAKTVNGSAPFKTTSGFAEVKAAASVLKVPAAIAVSIVSFMLITHPPFHYIASTDISDFFRNQ